MDSPTRAPPMCSGAHRRCSSVVSEIRGAARCAHEPSLLKGCSFRGSAMLDMENGSSLHPPPAAVGLAFRDEEGEINPDFVASAATAIAAGDAASLRALV